MKSSQQTRSHQYVQAPPQLYKAGSTQSEVGGHPQNSAANLMYSQVPQSTPPKKRNGTQLRQKVQMFKQELAQMSYKAHVSTEKVMSGNASVYLPAIHYILLIYSQRVAEYIKEKNPNNLVAQNDYAFMKNVYSVINKLFDLTPPFKIEEFFAPNTAIDRKVSFMLQLIQTIRSKDASLASQHKVQNFGATASVTTTTKGQKPKSVTFRQEDSVAIPNPHHHQGSTSSGGARLGDADRTPPGSTEPQQYGASTSANPYTSSSRVNHHQRSTNTVVDQQPQGILVNNIEQKRISVPSTGLQEGSGHYQESVPTPDTKKSSGISIRQMSHTLQRPSTAGPTQDTRNGILVTKNQQRAPSANSEQSRHSSKLAEQRASSQTSQQKQSRQKRENSAVNNYYHGASGAGGNVQATAASSGQPQPQAHQAQTNYMSRQTAPKLVTLRKDQSPSVQSNASSNHAYSQQSTNQPTILQQQKFLARINGASSSTVNGQGSVTSKTAAANPTTAAPAEDQQSTNSLTLGQPQPSSALSSNQVDKLLQQNSEFSSVIKNLHKTVKNLSVQMETIQNGYEKRFQMLASQNLALENRLSVQEMQLKKQKAKIKMLSMGEPVGAAIGGRGNSYNRNPVHGHHHTIPSKDRKSSNQHRTRQGIAHQQESSGEKQVLAAHQITFNQHIVMENRQADFGNGGGAKPTSDDGHQSITSVTFHQRDSGIALPVTKIQGSGSHHSNLAANNNGNDTGEGSGRPTKRSESHDTQNTFQERQSQLAPPSQYPTVMSAIKDSQKQQRVANNNNLALNNPHQYNNQKQQSSSSTNGGAGGGPTSNTTATFPQSTKYAHSYGQLGDPLARQSNANGQNLQHQQQHQQPASSNFLAAQLRQQHQVVVKPSNGNSSAASFQQQQQSQQQTQQQQHQ